MLTLAAIGAPDRGPNREAADSHVLRVITPFDTVDPVERPRRPRLVTRRRWRRACRALIANHTPPGCLRSGRRARIDLLPHQLEPALAIVRGLGSRLLLADAVGLGKTIQAGLVLSELRTRGAAERALILTPAGLREQWARELAERFDVAADIVDARDMRTRAAALPAGVNPWSTLDMAIASIDYVKRPEIVTAVASCRWDVLIVDEAHGVAGDTDRHTAIAALTARSPYVLLLTATPHSGDRRAFRSLCRLGHQGDPLLLFRRTRQDVRLAAGRHVQRLLVRPSGAEMRMHALVAHLSRAVLSDASKEKLKNDAAAWLAIGVLNKRALSSARSLELTIERRLAALESTIGARASDVDPWQLALPLVNPDGLDGETDDGDRAPELAGLALSDPTRERALLLELVTAARVAAQRETKIAALVRFLRRVKEPVIVFTEYRDTLLHLRDAIRVPAAVLHGGLDRGARAAALDDFTGGRRQVLLTTDAAGEGLNLHHACRIVVTLELPWNPMRLEQRIGRVDRIGQRRTVHALHLIGRDTSETRILERLRARILQAQADVGAANPLGSDDPRVDFDIDGDDRALARFVIDDAASTGARLKPRDADAARPSPEPDAPTPTVLCTEAAAEAARLALARRFTMRPSTRQMSEDQLLECLEADGAWLSFARASVAFPRHQMLLILRASCEDEAGRPIESTLVPIAIRYTKPRSRVENRRLVDEIVKSAMEQVGRLDGPPVEGNPDDSSFTRAFFATQLARERAIVATIDAALQDTFQPGLFDRRSEQQYLAARALAADANSGASRRLIALENASRLLSRSAQLLLVLAP